MNSQIRQHPVCTVMIPTVIQMFFLSMFEFVYVSICCGTSLAVSCCFIKRLPKGYWWMVALVCGLLCITVWVTQGDTVGDGGWLVSLLLWVVLYSDSQFLEGRKERKKEGEDNYTSERMSEVHGLSYALCFTVCPDTYLYWLIRLVLRFTSQLLLQ